MNKPTTPKTQLRRAAAALALALSALAAPVWADDDPILMDAEGIVRSVSISTAEVIISGFRYSVPPFASVSVRGSSSSIVALGEGMKVRLLYEDVEGIDPVTAAPDVVRVVHELEQLPDSQIVEEF